jgi:acid stress-induced BolA-like protein IbaG/YrbA
MSFWKGFDGMPDRERQRKLWGALRDELSSQEINSISLILTFTRAELNAMTSNN